MRPEIDKTAFGRKCLVIDFRRHPSSTSLWGEVEGHGAIFEAARTKRHPVKDRETPETPETPETLKQ